MTSTAHGRPDGDACPYCGWPDRAEPFQVVSRHGTAAGHTVWTRCGCGSLQMRVVDARGMNIVSRSRPAARQPADRFTSGGVGCDLGAGGG
ncbi:hypothetical protein QFZ24_006679 [Streptomyces phaeochromogenes]|jgi:hypothetical protein|uniref:hypothetical protein n=1 Tax=Streptomyces TaxID=1883 RepID=UPI00117E79A4|nr:MULTISPECIES: hypothetical protein [Streptomyces]MDQ0952756.1 hypothetical protein [Streptomyces phaeochromogenes]TRO69373.1 hypothetical protein E4K73_01540 [Streptomyces sp. IB201691-2A2]